MHLFMDSITTDTYFLFTFASEPDVRIYSLNTVTTFKHLFNNEKN